MVGLHKRRLIRFSANNWMMDRMELHSLGKVCHIRCQLFRSHPTIIFSRTNHTHIHVLKHSICILFNGQNTINIALCVRCTALVQQYSPKPLPILRICTRQITPLVEAKYGEYRYKSYSLELILFPCFTFHTISNVYENEELRYAYGAIKIKSPSRYYQKINMFPILLFFYCTEYVETLYDSEINEIND